MIGVGTPVRGLVSVVVDADDGKADVEIVVAVLNPVGELRYLSSNSVEKAAGNRP